MNYRRRIGALRYAASAALLAGAVLVCAQPGAAQALGGGSIGSRGDSIGGGQAIGAVSGTTSAAVSGIPDAPQFIGDQSHGSLYVAGQYAATCQTQAPTAGGALTVNAINHHGYDAAIIDGDVTIGAGWDAASYFTTTADSRAAILVIKGNLTVDSGEVFTPTVRKTFWLLYVTGNLVVNGEISMTARGANHSATGSDLVVNGPLRIYTGDLTVGMGTLTNAEIPAAGGAGAAGAVAADDGVPGGAGSGGGSGGGGSGGAAVVGAISGDGAAGTAYSGGPASGGVRGDQGEHAEERGGKGGDAVATVGRTAGGGAGNPGGAGVLGTGVSVEDGATGTAGALVVGVAGVLSGSGSATSNGGKGGDAVADGLSAPTGGGGGGGGGVHVVAGSGTITTAANGGAGGVASGGSAPRNGGAGGIGTARIGVIP